MIQLNVAALNNTMSEANHKLNILNKRASVIHLRSLGKIFQLFVTVSFIYLIFQKINWEEFWINVKTARIEWLALPLLYPFVTIAIDALRWQALFKVIKHRVQWHRLFHINLIGLFFDNILSGLYWK